jgi:hypothetical protein
VWLSQILIRHEQVLDPEVSFTVTGWETAQPRVARKRRDALLLAEKLVRSAREQANFETLAREFSEEPESRERGGSLGGVMAQHLSAWPQVLDAVATLNAGDVSDVVATEYGYHVFSRRAPVPEAIVSGAHVVIAHDSAPWIATAARGPLHRRSRAEAFTIARRIVERARENPQTFPELVAEYSEHRDAARAGDFGAWSTREPTGYVREVETLARLDVGEIAEPIDTMFGVQVIQRTPNRNRERYAVTQIILPFAAAEPNDHGSSRVTVLQKARELSAALREDPSRFEGFQRRWCCSEVSEVIEGRDLPALEAALAHLAPGQIGAEPIVDEDQQRYTILKRLDPNTLPPLVPPCTTLPGEAQP